MIFETIGVWLSVFLTISIFSFLYMDNPFYKAAEHIFIGISSGYWAAMYYWTQIQPNLFGRLWPKIDANSDQSFFDSAWYIVYDSFSFVYSNAFPEGGIDKGHEMNLVYIIPLFLGIFMLLRIFPKISWIGRWSLAYVVGLAAGLRMYGFLNSNILAQIKGSALPLFDDVATTFNSLLIIVGTLSGLFYFFFSKAHTGIFGKIGKVGIYFLMVSFGASFGFAVMGRISLLIGRFTELIDYSAASYHHATFWILGLMIILLGLWTYYPANKETSAELEI